MRRAVKIVVVVVAVLAIPAIATATGSPIRAITCYSEHYKPRKIVLSCADAGIWLGQLKWSRWTRTTAVATGVYNENTCTPTCSAGHTVSAPVEVTLSQPRTCPRQAHLVFARATFSFPGGPPPSAYRRFTFACPY